VSVRALHTHTHTHTDTDKPCRYGSTRMRQTDRRTDGVQQCVIIIIIIIKRQLISRRNMPEDITRARNVRPHPLYAPIQ